MKFSKPNINPGKMKNVLHGSQAVLIFLAWVLTIAVWTKGDGIDGRTAWYWALVSFPYVFRFVFDTNGRSMKCWFSIPGLIYLVAVPIWPRARRFGNVYAFASVDCLYAVLWFAAWVCVASYVAQGKAEGKSEDKNSDKDKSNKNTRATDSSKGGCDNWKYGSAAKCKLSTATVVFGVVILYVPFQHIGFRSFADTC